LCNLVRPGTGDAKEQFSQEVEKELTGLAATLHSSLPAYTSAISCATASRTAIAVQFRQRIDTFGGRRALAPASDSDQFRNLVGIGVKETQTALTPDADGEEIELALRNVLPNEQCRALGVGISSLS